MLARDYDRLIEIWENRPVYDGFSGTVMQPFFIKKVYSKIKTGAGSKFERFGILDFKNPVVFSVRGKKNGINYTENYFVKYKGNSYMIKGIEPIGLEGLEINLLCDEY